MQATTLEEYMATYGPVLGEQITTAVKPLHTPRKDPIQVCKLLREPFEAQAHVITAGVRQMQRDKSLIICGEVGTGKTMMAMAAVHTHANGKPYRAFVMCPPHLVEKWKREIETTLPGATATIASKYRDVSHLRFRCKPLHAEWWIFSQHTAKLGQPWNPVFSTLTPAQQRLNIHARQRGRSSVPHHGHCFCCSCGKPATRTKAHETIYLEPEDLSRKMTDCEACGEPLWQWENKYDRWPLASFVHRLGRGIVDYFVADESHELKSDDSEVALAGHKLMSISRNVLSLTGTLIGGYADHLRSMMFRLNPQIMRANGLTWEGATDFNEKYGRIEYRITEKGNGKVVSTRLARGKQLSGKTTKTRKPGIMPRLFPELIMRSSVFLALSEISDNLPELVQSVSKSPMDSDIRSEYERMKTAVTAEVKLMMARRDSRLLGAMLSVLLGYPDMPRGWGEIGYMEEMEDGSEKWKSVYTTKDFDIENRVMPKEQELIDLCLAEKAEGRQVWVYTTMTDKHDTCERLQKLIEAKGLRVKVLRAKVNPRQREAWIFEHGKGADVIISHPELVKTGLDLFAKCGNHNFCTLIFFQTGYNLFTLRQAGGRHWRIGQQKECRTHFLCYEQTMQENALALMGDKLTAAQAIEGSFSEEGLAALAGEDGSIEMAMAKSISNAIQCDAARSWDKLSGSHHKPKPVAVPAPVVTTAPADDFKLESAPRAEKPRNTELIIKTRQGRPRQNTFDFPDEPWDMHTPTRKAGMLF